MIIYSEASLNGAPMMNGDKPLRDDGRNEVIERAIHRESEEFYTNFFESPPQYKIYRRPVLGIRY